MICAIIAVTCLIFGFYAGVSITRQFKAEESANLKYHLQHQYDRIRAGVDADDPGQPYTPHQLISAEFEKQFKTNRRATERLNKKGE